MNSVSSTCMRRRHPAAVVLMIAVAACSSGSPADPPRGAETTEMSAEPPPSSSTSTSTPPALPPPWQPSSAGEPAPDLKVAATRALQAIGTYGVGDGTVERARERLRAAGEEPELAEAAGALLDPNTSGSVEIVYPQLGGLEPTEASVMVVARFTTATTVTRTVDVRVARGVDGWRATAIASDGGVAPSAPRLSDAARLLIDNTRVELPDSSRWDLEAGLVDDRVVELVQTIAVNHDLRVTVFGTGHPANVFGTDRVSNHTAGRGVDIWSIDGRPVADQRDEPAVLAIIEMAEAAGATEIGAPVDTDGPGGIVFTNTVHHDHLHLAFRR